MPSPEDHGAKVRQGLRRARLAGVALGGLRPARAQANQQAHAEALQEALSYRDILVAGRAKSLTALSRDLFAAGHQTSTGRPWSPEMVRRLRARFQEALQAMAAGSMEDEWTDWRPEQEIRLAVSEGNALALRWHLRMARKEYGDEFADWLIQPWLCSDHAGWFRIALKGP